MRFTICAVAIALGVAACKKATTSTTQDASSVETAPQQEALPTTAATLIPGSPKVFTAVIDRVKCTSDYAHAEGALSLFVSGSLAEGNLLRDYGRDCRAAGKSLRLESVLPDPTESEFAICSVTVSCS